MKMSAVYALTLAIAAAGCSSSSTSPSTTTPTKPTFTATLSPSNEVPAIIGAEASGSGTATITFDVTKDAAGNITAGTATFVVNLTGFPPGTPINIAHIHQAAAGVNGGIVVNTGLSAGQNVLTTGSGSFSVANISVTPEIAQGMLSNPAGFYFNVHTTLNAGGVARGQLSRVS